MASIAVALFSVPILLRYLGTDRFGVISLVWIVEGQFSIFDLGLSQALTKLVAEKLGASREQEVPAIFWGSMLIMSVFGVIAALILRFFAPWLVYHALKVPTNIQSETLFSFHLVAISLPIVISSAGLRGLLAAYQRFDLLSTVRVPISLFSYLVPLAVLPFSHELGPFVLVLVFARFIAWSIHLILCLRVSPGLRSNISIKGAPFAHMFRFGGWMTVTNVVSPIMVNLDRVLIGALISISAVAYYATPYEAATKLWIIPSSVSAVLFPAFAAALVQDRGRAALLFEKGVKYIFLSMFPIVISALALGPWVLKLWLGVAFAENSRTVFQLLVLGVFANSLAQVPFWQIQAANRPDLAAKVHILELPCYLLVFWKLTTTYGITGAGIAWMVRTSIDALIMFTLSRRLLPEGKTAIRHLIFLVLGSAPACIIAVSLSGIIPATSFVVVVCLIFLVIAWRFLLSENERGMLQRPWRFFDYRRRAVVGETS